MVKFFRKIRQKFITENRFRKYFIYAIGEIFLVVIGILIAIQINSLNERKQDTKYLRSIYSQIKEDLIRDTSIIAQNLKDYYEKDKRIENILDKKIKPSFYDTINEQNYLECKICISEPTNYRAFYPLDKGYDLLKENKNDKILEDDSLSFLILRFYSENLDRLTSHVTTIRNIVRENINQFEQYSWFTDWIRRKFNKDFIVYIFENEDYRKMLSKYQSYYKNNYIRRLEIYLNQSSEIINLIDKKMSE